MKIPLLGTAVLFSRAIGGEQRQGNFQISDKALEGERGGTFLEAI